jgi:hypothetical protein
MNNEKVGDSVELDESRILEVEENFKKWWEGCGGDDEWFLKLMEQMRKYVKGSREMNSVGYWLWCLEDELGNKLKMVEEMIEEECMV